MKSGEDHALNARFPSMRWTNARLNRGRCRGPLARRDAPFLKARADDQKRGGPAPIFLRRLGDHAVVDESLQLLVGAQPEQLVAPGVQLGTWQRLSRQYCPDGHATSLRAEPRASQTLACRTLTHVVALGTQACG